MHRSEAAPTKPANFNRVARVYRWAEYLALGLLLQRARCFFLPALASRRRALLLGDGDGRFTAALLRRHPQVEAVAVDGSSAMLHLLRKRCIRDGTSQRLRTLHRPVLGLNVSPPPDLIVTHFLLDCLTQEEVRRLASELAAAAEPGCFWLFAEFGYPHASLARVLARVYIRLLYAAFRALTGLAVQQLPDPQSALEESGFSRMHRRHWLRGFLYTELWQLTGPGVPGSPGRATQLGGRGQHQPEGEC